MIVNVDIDPLRPDGEMLAQELRTAGVPAEQWTWAGAPHEVFGAAPLVADVTQAQALAEGRLRGAFGTARTPMVGLG